MNGNIKKSINLLISAATGVVAGKTATDKGVDSTLSTGIGIGVFTAVYTAVDAAGSVLENAILTHKLNKAEAEAEASGNIFGIGYEEEDEEDPSSEEGGEEVKSPNINWDFDEDDNAPPQDSDIAAYDAAIENEAQKAVFMAPLSDPIHEPQEDENVQPEIKEAVQEKDTEAYENVEPDESKIQEKIEKPQPQPNQNSKNRKRNKHVVTKPEVTAEETAVTEEEGKEGETQA